MKITRIYLLSFLLITSACSAVSIPTKSTVQPTGQAATSEIQQPTMEAATPAEQQPTESSPEQLVGTSTPEVVIPNTAATQSSPAAVCTAPADLTPSLTEGPYYSPGSPEATDLSSNLPGTKLVLTGYVLDQNCNPVPGAWLDFWQADSQGNYDNQGYTLRGHQFTDENGMYTLTTVVPGLYPGRTEHIHVKVKAPNGPELTSQLFFPGVAENSGDGIYNSTLLLNITSESANELQATFNFIVVTQ